MVPVHFCVITFLATGAVKNAGAAMVVLSTCESSGRFWLQGPTSPSLPFAMRPKKHRIQVRMTHVLCRLVRLPLTEIKRPIVLRYSLA